MDWTHADGEVAGCIERLRTDRLAWQHQLEDACLTESRALEVIFAARAMQVDARRHVREDTVEIDLLLAEQRGPSD